MNISQTSTGQENRMSDSCTGIVSIHNFFNVNAIPLYTHPDGKPFDALKFKQKRIRWHKVYVIQSGLGERFSPHSLLHAEASLYQIKSNQRMWNSKNNWVRSHLKPEPAYALSFKLIGEYGEWLKVELNGKTRETCYIRRNDSYMHFTSWEEIVALALMVRFNGLPAYDKPNGNELAINDGFKKGKILALEGEWAHIQYYYGSDAGECWVKWKDETGMLLTNHPIYEFIQ